MTIKADWYFDVISPYSYLQRARFDSLPGELQITPKPVVFGAVLKHWGQIGPAEIAPKRLQTYRQCQWIADRRGLPFQMPERHPFNPITALRLVIAAGSGWPAIDAAFHFVFVEGRAPDNDADLAELAARLDVDPGAGGDQAVKDRLRANTEEAIARSVFGVPTFSVDGQNFWGDDATEMLADWLADRTLFDTPAMRRIERLEVGVRRER